MPKHLTQLRRRRFLQLAASAATAAIPTRAARAQGFPARAIRLVIPYPPGGIVDALGRPWADKMKTLLGTARPRCGRSGSG